MIPHVLTIPPHRAFADALAAGLIAEAKNDPLGLARTTLIIPNNRSGRALRDAFVRRASGGLLMPRLVAIGDPELDERLGAALDPIDDADPLPPAIEPLPRLLMLARMIEETGGPTGERVTTSEAFRLASDLARTLDQLIAEEVAPGSLARLIDPATEPMLAGHWQRSLGVLDTILARWPKQLADLNRIDAADRRNRALDRAARRWAETPPPGPVIAAGILVAPPAVARLLRTVARLPQGRVVLPGLDLAMAEDEWQALGPHDPDPDTGSRRPAITSHPQYALKQLLDRMGVARAEVTRWRWGGGQDAPAVRTRAIGHAMAPAAFTGRWRTLRPAERRLTGIRAIECSHPAEEAQVIALALRQAIAEPGATAALVTPDRGLATRVARHLKRWNIDADDSAGRPLSTTAPGALILALAEAAAERFAPVALLSLLKHSLVTGGADEESARGDWLDRIRRLDRALRGPRPPAGLDGITAFLASGEGRDRRTRLAARDAWEAVHTLLIPLETAFTSTNLTTLLAALREAAHALAGDAAWSGPAGRAAAELIASLEAAAPAGPRAVDPAELPLILKRLMDGIAIRPPQGGHPRVFIWGLIEARLQHADLMILGGLNEGVWPALPSPDPWLAPRIRAELGLPGLDRAIGLAAHDFASALGARRVLVTRARRDARAPAVASRFWLRLEAMTGGVTRAPELCRWARSLDKPADFAPAPRPAPTPPAADRPRQLAVTKLDRLKADPFAFYADAMLGLSRWDAVDAEPTPAWRGNAVHAVFEAWMREDVCDPAKLRPRAEAMLDNLATHPVLKALWTPRLIEAIDWAAATITAYAAEGRAPLAAEIFGETEIDGIRLYGKVDRIDHLPDGSLAIVDYKTGKPPSAAQVSEGFAMQLGLLGLIAERQGFPDIAGTPATFEYWSLGSKAGQLGYIQSPVGGKRAGAIQPQDFVALAERHFAAAAARWLTGDAPFTAKLHPEHAPHADYDQLMRLDEWYGRADG